MVVAFVHWGVEQQVCPTARQQALARQLVAAGADLVVGSHAHVLQPLASVAGMPVAYGLGNFVFYGKAAAPCGPACCQVDVSAVPGAGAERSPRRHHPLGTGDYREWPAGRRRSGPARTRCPPGGSLSGLSGSTDQRRHTRPGARRRMT